MSWPTIHPDSAKLLEGIGIRLSTGGAAPEPRYDYDEPQEQFEPPRQPGSYEQHQRAAPYQQDSYSGAGQRGSQLPQKKMTFDIPADERAGVHAIMVSDGEQGLSIIEEMPPGGQLATNVSPSAGPACRFLAQPHSGWPTLLKLTCWVCGQIRQLQRKRARAHQIGRPNRQWPN
jgi:hypothetical protein